MSVAFFYSTIIIILIVFFIIIQFKPLEPKHIIIGAVSAVYSITFDVTLGKICGLYYYINDKQSIFYIIISSIFIYALLNILYTLFLPRGTKKTIIYSIIWITGMCIFEFMSLKFGTVVFTGWKPIPWSLVTYIVTYLWVYLLFRYLSVKSCGR